MKIGSILDYSYKFQQLYLDRTKPYLFLFGLMSRHSHTDLQPFNHIVPCRVGREPLEGQLLMAEILQRPVDQLVAAAVVIAGDQSVGCQIVQRPGVFEKPVDGLTLPDIGDDDRVRAATRQKILGAVVVHQPAIDGPSKPLPVALPAPELGVLPSFLFRGFESLPPLFIPIGGDLFDVFVHLAAAHIADVKGFAQIENLLVEKTAVHADDDRHVPTVIFLYLYIYGRPASHWRHVMARHVVFQLFVFPQMRETKALAFFRQWK